MRRSLRLAPAALALAFGCCATSSAARADDGPPPPQPPAAPAATPAAEYDALLGAYRKAMAAWQAEQRKLAEEFRKKAAEAKERGETAPAMPATSMVSPAVQEYLPKFAAFAEKNPDAPQAVDALVFVVQNGLSLPDNAPAKAAIAKLLADHVNDGKVQTIAYGLDRYAGLGIDPAAARADIVKRSTNADVKSAALYGPVAQTFALGSKATEEQKKAARPTLEQVAKDYPATRWGKRAAGTLNEIDHLQVGMVAPDFEGKDAEGKTIRLSDFRGKAVLIDYWGFW